MKKGRDPARSRPELDHGREIMDETFEDYGAGHADSSAYVRLELFRQWQRRRVVAVSVGDMYLAIARAFAKLGPRHVPRVLSITHEACVWYRSAGLTHQAVVAWRWAQAIRRAQWRRAT
jgi:hypothetical protein